MRRFVLIATCLASLAVQAQDLKRGEIVDGNVTATNEAITYAYYLPRAWSPDRKWPVLYVFDPRQRGAFAATLFREAAEEFGWIIVSSNNTRSDTNTEMNVPALDATIPDARRRFSVDSRREYLAGFSGTAILAWALAATTSEFAGVIGCSGRPIEGKGYGVPFAWFGTTGDRDFNYLETMEIERGLRGAGGAHHLEVFAGGHRWAPPDVLRRGLEWLELEAMKRGTRPRDEAMIENAFRGQLGLARTERDPLNALRRFESIVRMFDTLTDVSTPRQAAEEIRNSRTLEVTRAEAERAEKFERSQRRRLGEAIAAFMRSENVRQAPALAHALDIPRLQKIAGEDSYTGRAAQRVLESIYGQLDFYLAQQLSGQKLLIAKRVAQMIHPPK